MKSHPTPELVEELRAGRMIILADDEQRENEGDFVVAASCATAEHMNFMTRYGRGLLCLALTRERCATLSLPLMDPATDERHATNFTVTIDAREGITTGVSAQDRAATVAAAVADDAAPHDLVQPGHLQCLMSQPGGVLSRAGHTEGGCDLARLAGMEPAAVIVEILNEDGTMARRPQLEELAAEHQLKIGTIEDLIRYRVEREPTVERISRAPIDTECGMFDLVTYEDRVSQTSHLALVAGDIGDGAGVLVRVHVQSTLRDVVLATDPTLGWPLRDALRRIAEEGRGVAVVLRWPESQVLHNRGHETDTNASPADRRMLGVGSQILADLGVRSMRLLSAPQILHGLGGFGLTVDEYLEH